MNTASPPMVHSALNLIYDSESPAVVIMIFQPMNQGKVTILLRPHRSIAVIHVMASCAAATVKFATKRPEFVSVQTPETPMVLDRERERVRVQRSAVTMSSAEDLRCALTVSVSVTQRIRMTADSKEVEVEEEVQVHLVDAVEDAVVF